MIRIMTKPVCQNSKTLAASVTEQTGLSFTLSHIFKAGFLMLWLKLLSITLNFVINNSILSSFNFCK